MSHTDTHTHTTTVAYASWGPPTEAFIIIDNYTVLLWKHTMNVFTGS